MPVAGDEGYEKLVICPYDKAHEIRIGRMQFHLEKCRKNFPNTEMVRCPFNSVHFIPKIEIQYHTEKECGNRVILDRYTHVVGNVSCPVKDLVPVNAIVIPDCEESWDDYEAQGSVLNSIKDQAANKTIFRSMQCESKSKRKNFRKQESARLMQLDENYVAVDNTPRVVSNNEPLPKPSKVPVMKVQKQDPAVAIAAINKQFRTLDLDMKPSTSTSALSETSSMYNRPPSDADTASSSRGLMSYAAASSNQPSTSTSVSSTPSSRPSTAMSIQASVNRARIPPPTEEGFCQIPIPGLGRGKARR